jgi:hypothetical protein
LAYISNHQWFDLVSNLSGSKFIPESTMFCPRALLFLSGVCVCAWIGGCSTASPLAESTPVEPVMETAAVSHTHTTVIAADSIQLTRPVSSEDVIAWSLRGTSDDIIIDRIEHSPSIFHLSASEEIHLRDAGVSNDVIRAMKATAS